MLDDIRKGLLAGLGAVFLTKEKIEEAIRKMVDEAKINKEDARRLTDELVESGEKQWSRAEEGLAEAVRKALKNLDVAKKSEVDEIKARLRNLEQRVGMLETPESPIEV